MADMDLSTLNQTVKEQSIFVSQMMSEMGKIVVGQKEMIEGITMGLLTGGHILLEGVPGLAKTLTISTLAQTISLDFHRIQFTPDLLPTDLIGTMIFNPKSGDFSAKKGPIFSNIVLADEINRAPAKVQSALLEAMAEKQVTIGEQSYKLDHPFLVLATQNPLEQEGTYPLPEAQMDRFMFKIDVTYPTKEEELEIVSRMGHNQRPEIQKVITKEQLLNAVQIVDQIYVDQKVKNYIVDLIMATRQPAQYGLSRLEKLITVGGSPRASLSLIRAAKAHAFLRGRGFVTVEDIKAIVYKVLRHRLILSYEAEAENLKADDIIKEVLSAIEVSG
ncbi:AAA family ATPase [Pseudobdellovibrio exovorus]|uniref:Putative Mg chelatase n=1 Tax=Pseudobdellovibrio exovorus JSS TaxID=1184267 RepID=M4VPP6_9BACT|nr:MoxR family ATPase [Pseudobdellovibrio exovorus]AGH95099.1 putative Mg chelatase [Pseudobdellovibrio exovorus JSS]